jgi:hypothetical protein
MAVELKIVALLNSLQQILKSNFFPHFKNLFNIQQISTNKLPHGGFILNGGNLVKEYSVLTKANLKTFILMKKIKQNSWPIKKFQNGR